MRTLLACETTDARAAEAIELFCYQATKWIGAFAAVLGGVDTLVFSGGIGEHAPAIRQRICDRLAFLGIAADRQRNARNAPVISPEGGPVTVRELMIARSVVRVLRLAPASQPT
jgi:acetate kinase